MGLKDRPDGDEGVKHLDLVHLFHP